jgi:subtilisin family serine protease
MLACGICRFRLRSPDFGATQTLVCSTSYGGTVVVDADGYEVESVVPGGGILKGSGTSMASPNVTNLAAKLFALDPSLTPEQVVDLIELGATTSEDSRRHLIDEKRSVALLKELSFAGSKCLQ